MSNDSPEEYRNLVSEALEKRLERFDRWLRDTLAYHRGITAGFDARLDIRWRSAFDLFAIIWTEVQELGDAINERCRQKAIVEEQDAILDAVITLHARAVLIASEVYSLLRTGHGVGALARWRSLYEVLIVMRLIHDNDRELALRYLNHAVVQRWRAAHKYQEHAATLGEETLEQAFLDQLDNAVDELCDTYGRNFSQPNGWASTLVGKNRPSMADLAEHAKLDHMRPCYSLASDGIHPEHKGMRQTVFTMGADILLAGPSNYGSFTPSTMVVS